MTDSMKEIGTIFDRVGGEAEAIQAIGYGLYLLHDAQQAKQELSQLAATSPDQLRAVLAERHHQLKGRQ
jgi:hypothetical protein